MGGLPEISGRVLSISLSKQQPTSKIYELVEKGEEVANIRFQHKEAIVEASGGSFFIAQQICNYLAVQNNILESQDNKKDIVFDYNWVKKEFLDSIGYNFRVVMNEFAAIDHDGPNPGAALVLLGLLRIENDHYVLFDEAAKQYPRFESTFQWLSSDKALNDRMSRPLDSLRKACLNDYFYYDTRFQRIEIQDIQLLYYLSNVDWREFARRNGYLSEIVGNRIRIRRLAESGATPTARGPRWEFPLMTTPKIFVSYSRKDKDWLDRLQEQFAPLARGAPRRLGRHPDRPGQELEGGDRPGHR